MKIAEDNYQIEILTYFLRLKIYLLALIKTVFLLSHNESIFVDGPDGFHELSLLEVLKAL